MKYFFIPGRKWALSLAELRTVLSSRGIPFVELSCDKDVFLFDVQMEGEDMNELFIKLGGFIKCGHVIDDPLEFLRKMYSENTGQSKNVRFAISYYGSKQSKKKEKSERHAMGMKFKEWFSGNERSARFVSKRTELETSLVLLSKNKVLEQGFELNRLVHPKTNALVWGITLAVQDYEGFSKRDYSRPVSNRRKGMIPPKLARIMVNLAGVQDGGTIWDPFCGSGTILMESLSLGYRVVGTDIDPKAIEETKENLSWLCDEYWISHKNYALFRHDILDGLPEGITFDAIVTEPYLGPVLRKEITVERLDEISRKIVPLYEELGKIDSKHVVVVVPGFKTEQGWIDMDVALNPSKFADISLKVSSQPLQWDRPNSIIRRNIKVFESK